MKSPSFCLLWSYLAISYSSRLSSKISIISNIFISSFSFIKSLIFLIVLSIKYYLWFNYIKLFTFTSFNAYSACFSTIYSIMYFNFYFMFFDLPLFLKLLSFFGDGEFDVFLNGSYFINSIILDWLCTFISESIWEIYKHS